jgi:hypothetical protein
MRAAEWQLFKKIPSAMRFIQTHPWRKLLPPVSNMLVQTGLFCSESRLSRATIMLFKSSLLSCVLCPLAAIGRADTSLYVAANGSNSAAGTIAAPFATLAHARDEIRVRKEKGALRGPVTVFVRGGLYQLTETLKLDQRDSGTPGAPVVYRAFPDENPVITVAVAINGFVPYEGKSLKPKAGASSWNQMMGSGFTTLFCRTCLT